MLLVLVGVEQLAMPDIGVFARVDSYEVAERCLVGLGVGDSSPKKPLAGPSNGSIWAVC